MWGALSQNEQTCVLHSGVTDVGCGAVQSHLCAAAGCLGRHCAASLDLSGCFMPQTGIADSFEAS